MGIAEMTLTPEKMDELERLANAAAEVLGHRVSGVRDYVLYESVLQDLIRELDPAAVRELVRLARIGLTSSGESGVQRGGRAIQWPEGINTAEMPEDGAV